MITTEQAHEMGAKGAQPTEAERLLFEAWMRGHCWMIHGDWDGTTYVHAAERNLRQVHPGAMNTRQLWAAWRDRAALAAPVQPVGKVIASVPHLRSISVELLPEVPVPPEDSLIYSTPPAAQPAVPDAMTSADIQEHIEYVAGWNDCRQAMMEMMK